MKVALLIGHSKDKPGACNKAADIYEYEFNKILTALVEDFIEENSDIRVDRFYRKHGYSKLPSELNKEKFDFVVSFHCNAFNRKASGTETLYYDKSVKGKKCAEVLQSNIVKILGLSNRGIRGRNVNDRGGNLLKHTNAVTILLEPFFIDNDDDLDVVSQKLEKLVKTIGEAIIKCEKIIMED